MATVNFNNSSVMENFIIETVRNYYYNYVIENINRYYSMRVPKRSEVNDFIVKMLNNIKSDIQENSAEVIKFVGKQYGMSFSEDILNMKFRWRSVVDDIIQKLVISNNINNEEYNTFIETFSFAK